MVNKVRKMDQKRRTFSREFKLDAIRLVKEEGHSAYEVNENLGLGPQVVERWIREYEVDEAQAFPGVGQSKESEKEIYALRRQRKFFQESLNL